MVALTRGSVAIVGAAESDLGAVAALMSPMDLIPVAETLFVKIPLANNLSTDPLYIMDTFVH